MEENLKKMMERFYNAELSIEEERELCCFLREHDVPAELRKDKEAIIALCGEEQDIELPAGAETRLEAMLDTLAEEEELCTADERSTSKTGKRLLKVPRSVWHGAAAAAILAACCFLVNDDEQLPVQHAGQAGNVAQVVVPEQEYDEQEEDTFDNPKDAMECFMAAMGDIKLAVNTTENNTREIGDALNDALLPYKDIIRINM